MHKQKVDFSMSAPSDLFTTALPETHLCRRRQDFMTHSAWWTAKNHGLLIDFISLTVQFVYEWFTCVSPSFNTEILLQKRIKIMFIMFSKRVLVLKLKVRCWTAVWRQEEKKTTLQKQLSIVLHHISSFYKQGRTLVPVWILWNNKMSMPVFLSL